MKDRPVVVLSRNYSTGLNVIRSLHKAGYTVDLIASASKEGGSKNIAASAYIREHKESVCVKVDGKEDVDLLNRMLEYEGKTKEKPVLIPTDDYTTSVMDLNRDKLEGIYIMPGIKDGKAGILKHYMDKSVQGMLARNCGIDTPRDWVIDLRNEEPEIPEDMIYPCWCKPLESSMGYKREMAKCDGEEALKEHLAVMRNNFSGRSILVQEWLDIEEEIDMEGVCLDQDIVLPMFVWKRMIGKHDRGVPLAGKTFPIDELGDFREKVYELLRSFHYYGMFDLGFNKVGDKIYFNENNLRSGGTNFVYQGSGINLPDIFVKGILGEEITAAEREVKEFGKTYLYEKVAWEDYLHRNFDRTVLNELYETSEILSMKDDEDPEPGRLFLEEMEARAKRLERRESLLRKITEETGMDRDEAFSLYKKAKANVGISLRDYVKYRFWEHGEEQQQEEYDKIIKRKEQLKQRREDCIADAMQKAGWDYDYAAEQIKETRKRLGISYKDYRKYDFCLMKPEEQDAAYAKILAEKS